MKLFLVLSTAALLSLLTMAWGASGGASQVIFEAQDSVGAQLPTRSQLAANFKLPLGSGFEEAITSAADLAQMKDFFQHDHQPAAGLFRGSNEVSIYEKASPAVVLILTESGSGSGSMLSKDGTIITNWHVVGSNRFVDVVFRPLDPAEDAFSEKSYRARVLKVDQVADLALLRLLETPPNRPTLALSTSSPKIGADVLALGHPNGYNWSLTRGIVSGIRNDFNWQYKMGLQHLADVIQTQTPINPGNSGGPLLNDEMQIVGINSFGSVGELTNFAVSSEMVREFLKQPESRFAPAILDSESLASPKSCKGWEVIGELWSSDDAELVYGAIDTNCDGRQDGVLEVGVQENSPQRFYADTNGDGKIDVTLFDSNGDEVWDLSFYDVNGSGDTDVVGIHNNEGRVASFLSNRKFLYQLSNS